MKRKTKYVPLRETIQLTLRAIGYMNRFSPGFVPSMVLSNVFRAASPFPTIYLSALLINELAGQRRPDIVWNLIVITVSVTAAVALVGFLLEYWAKVWREKYIRQWQQFLSSKMLDMDYADIDKQHTWDLYNRVCEGDRIRGYGFDMVGDGIRAVTRALGGIVSAAVLTVSLFTTPVPQDKGVLSVLNGPAFVIIFVGMLSIVLVFSSFTFSWVRTKEASATELSLYCNRTFFFFGSLGLSKKGLRSMDIRMYNQQNIAQHEFFAGNKPYEMSGLFGKLCSGLPGICVALTDASGAFLTGVAYIYVCLKALSGAIGIGSVTQYVSALTSLSNSVSLLLEGINLLQSNTPHLQTLFEYLDIPNTMYQGSLPTEKRMDRDYVVEFKDVSFKYPGSEIWALRHVNMKFKVGKRLAIVGENGSGKTTFIKLLCRLYDPQEGQILLNGIDIRKYNYRDYMDVFAVVFQDFQLLSQPLGNNVAGASEYDPERVTKALIDAGFGYRLETLPNGLETMLYKDFGENGVEVSGGEAQKIAIARALYKDAPFIILDEPTASLDPIAEAEIYAKFNDISGDKTAIYISHRLSSCKFCDEIAVFHEGGVIQHGTHAELVADENGKYYELWNAQAQYYTEKTV